MSRGVESLNVAVATGIQEHDDYAVAFIEAHRDEPFFVYLAHSMPHVPLFASEAFEGRTKRGLFGDVIEEIDDTVGRVLATLERLGLDDNTLVIFTSDNGSRANNEGGSVTGAAVMMSEMGVS